MNREKTVRLASVLLIFCFIAFLAVAMGATVLREKETYSFFENRNLAVMPQATGESLLDGSYFSGVDTYLTEHAAARNTVLKLKTYMDMYVLGRPVVNDVVMGDGLLLPYNAFEDVDEEFIEIRSEEIALRIKTHADLTESLGGSFYYIAVPCQYVCYEDSYPWYLNNRAEYTEKSSAALFAQLDELGISYIDMLELYEASGRPEHFSSTVDNHYSILGAYDTYAALMERIVDDTEFEPDVLTLEDFTLTELPNTYLGSRTRKLFGLWDSGEHLAALVPNEAVFYDRWNYGNLGAPIVYHMPGSEYEDATYSLYMGGDIAETVIKTYREELPTILIYGDSFTNAVECIIWQSFDTMWSLDYRHYGEMTLDEYIAAVQPDIVVCIRDYEALLDTYGNGQ